MSSVYAGLPDLSMRQGGSGSDGQPMGNYPNPSGQMPYHMSQPVPHSQYQNQMNGPQQYPNYPSQQMPPSSMSIGVPSQMAQMQHPTSSHHPQQPSSSMQMQHQYNMSQHQQFGLQSQNHISQSNQHQMSSTFSQHHNAQHPSVVPQQGHAMVQSSQQQTFPQHMNPPTQSYTPITTAAATHTPVPANVSSPAASVPNPQPQQIPPKPSGPAPASVQKMLDDNNQYLLLIYENQSKGKSRETMEYQQKLHRNLVYLASVADAAMPSHTSQSNPQLMGASHQPHETPTPVNPNMSSLQSHLTSSPQRPQSNS